MGSRGSRCIRVVVSLAIWAWLATCIQVARSQDGLGGQATAKAPSFESDVAPLLKTYCWKCHGGEGREAELDLRSLPLILQGGKSGPAIGGSAEKSLLFQKLAKGEMPPGKELKPTKAHLATIRAWLDGGARAAYREHAPRAVEKRPTNENGSWAFRPPTRPPIPSVAAKDRVRTPIDAFVLAKLEAKGLTLSLDADPRTLLRRMYLDVIGLPPTPEEIADFELRIADSKRPDPIQSAIRNPQSAIDVLVDRLLASPHFGERWGRHWLDAAGYVDSSGSDNDAAIIKPREGIWQYRDWVVRAVNEDMPYDRFVKMQLAGDELLDWRSAARFTPEIREALVATGFLRQAADTTDEPELNTADIRHQVLYDTLQVICGNLLGLTVHCAQCHDHKFDPILQEDYYRLAAVFAPAYNVQAWQSPKERFLPDIAPAEKRKADAANAEIDKRLAQHNGRIGALRAAAERRVLQRKLAAVPETQRADLQTALAKEPEKRTGQQKGLIEKFGTQVKVSPQEVDREMTAAERDEASRLQQEIASLPGRKQTHGKIQALWDVGPPPPTYLYRRGDYAAPGRPVSPGAIATLCGPDDPVTFAKSAKGAMTSGNRLALARWLTRADHPLTARVIVNRVWQQYFGRGIVATSENFGASGSEPTHPELLDWLAVDFVSHGFSLKRLHRMILTSSVYRQSSHEPTTAAAGAAPRTVDSDNKLLWKTTLRRLESEIVRDRMLAVSGALQRTVGGPPLPLKPNTDGSVEIETAPLSRPTDQFRRSLYVFCRRNYHLSELGVFDQPTVAHHCTRRMPSAVVLQSLTMLNGKFVVEQADRFAQRVRQTAGADDARLIQVAFALALCRPPSAEEMYASLELLARQRARYRKQPAGKPTATADAALVDLCHMLLNTNEFLYVD